MKFKLEEAKFKNIDIKKVSRVFKDLEFKTLLARVEKLKKNNNYELKEVDKFARNEKN